MKAVVVGLGRIGLGYDLGSADDQVFSHTKALMLHPKFTLLAGVDPDETKQKQFNDYSGKPAYSKISEVKEKPELVVISVPTELHLSSFQEAAELKPKVIILEKPIAAAKKDADQIMSIAKEGSIKLYVNYMRRVDPGILRLGAEIKTLGPLITGNMYYSRGLVTNGSHFLSLLIDWLGVPDKVIRINKAPAKNVKNDSEVNFYLTYRNKLISCLAGDDSCYTLGEIDLLMEKGRIRVSSYGEEVEIFKPVELTRNITRLVPSRSLVNASLSKYQYNVLEDVLAGNFESSVSNALKTLELCERINGISN